MSKTRGRDSGLKKELDKLNEPDELDKMEQSRWEG